MKSLLANVEFTQVIHICTINLYGIYFLPFNFQFYLRIEACKHKSQSMKSRVVKPLRASCVNTVSHSHDSHTMNVYIKAQLLYT